MKFLGASSLCFRQIQDEKQQTHPGSGGKIYQETLTNPGSVSKLREAPESWSSWRPKLTGCSRLACCSLRVFAHVCCRWYPYAFLVDTHIPCVLDMYLCIYIHICVVVIVVNGLSISFQLISPDIRLCMCLCVCVHPHSVFSFHQSSHLLIDIIYFYLDVCALQ
jgi:hypothetical protein